MTPLILHPTTSVLIEQLVAQLPSSLLLSGDSGVGLLTIARHLASNRVATILQPLDAKQTVDDQTGTISVDAIRQLYDTTRSKQTHRQVIIIDDGDRMSHAAQNAFLKLLEEPGRHVHFIMTTHQPDGLLPTVMSRLQHKHLRPITTEQSNDFIASFASKDATKQRQLLFMAEGLPAEITRLAQNDDYFRTRAQSMADARQALQGDRYQKLLTALKHTQNRAEALQLLDSMTAIARRSLSQKPQAQLVTQLALIADIRDKINAGGSVRLQLARIVL